MSIGYQIRRARMRQGMSAAALASQAQVNKRELCRIEHNRVHLSVEVLLRLCRVLGVCPDMILEWEPARVCAFEGAMPDATPPDGDPQARRRKAAADARLGSLQACPDAMERELADMRAAFGQLISELFSRETASGGRRL